MKRLDDKFTFKTLLKDTLSIWLLALLPLSLLITGLVILLDFNSVNGSSTPWWFYPVFWVGFNLFWFLFTLWFLWMFLPNFYHLRIEPGAYLLGNQTSIYWRKRPVHTIPFSKIESVEVHHFLSFIYLKIRLKKDETNSPRTRKWVCCFQTREEAKAAYDAFYSSSSIADEATENV